MNKELLNQAESTLSEVETGERGENVSLGMTDKVSAARCCLYQLFPHCVWLSRRWAAQRCPPGLERRRTGRGAWRDKNLISLQPFVASPSIPSSSHPRRTTEWYYRYKEMKRKQRASFSLRRVWWWKDRKARELWLCFFSHHFLLSWHSVASRRPGEGYHQTLDSGFPTSPEIKPQPPVH